MRHDTEARSICLLRYREPCQVQTSHLCEAMGKAGPPLLFSSAIVRDIDTSLLLKYIGKSNPGSYSLLQSGKGDEKLLRSTCLFDTMNFHKQ